MAFRVLIVCGGSGVNLLGQRRILRMDAEIQVDVTKELVIPSRTKKDQRSLTLELDKDIDTTAIVMKEARSRIKKLKNNQEKDKDISVYLKLDIKNSTDIAHMEILADHYPSSANLEYGLARAPAVGGVTIRHEVNQERLRQLWGTVFTKFGQNLGSENPVEVWLVSSTAGGTGEGVHRYLAASLAEYIKKTVIDARVDMHFIRIGQLTYRSVDHPRTAMNSFMGIAQDASFPIIAKKDFPHITTNWYYIDLPDVGIGERAKRTRAEIVEMACKAVMLDELQEDLQKLLVNNHGAPMVIVRTGYWGRDFEDNVKYYETLKQLIEKLHNLIRPDYYVTFVQDKIEPEFSATALDDKLSKVSNYKIVLKQMEGGWQFPNININSTKGNLDDVEKMLPSIKTSLSELLDSRIDEIHAEFRIRDTIEVEGKRERKLIPLKAPSGTIEEDNWFEEIKTAHRTRAWCLHLLGFDLETDLLKSDGLVLRFLRQSRELSKEFHGFNPFATSQKRAKRASGLLRDFLTNLVKINRLLELEKAASIVLDRELTLEPTAVLNMANKELEVVEKIVGPKAETSIKSSNLSHIVDQIEGKTWLGFLREAAKRGDTERFHDRVLQGATGLTEDGLKNVLKLELSMEISDIQNTLESQMGRMTDSDKHEYEAPWWAGKKPTWTDNYEYRIIPHVDRELQSRLQSRALTDGVTYRYIFTELGLIGLYVLAFHGVSLTQALAPDMESTPTFLLEPFVPVVHDVLKKWADPLVPNKPSGQFEIIKSGVGTEPIFETPLRKAGLSSEEIGKIGQYYKFIK